MQGKKNRFGYVMAGMLTSIALVSGPAHARDEAPGYTDDSAGNIIRRCRCE